MVSDKWCQQWYRALEICHHHHHALHHCLARNFDSRQIKNDNIKQYLFDDYFLSCERISCLKRQGNFLSSRWIISFFFKNDLVINWEAESWSVGINCTKSFVTKRPLSLKMIAMYVGSCWYEKWEARALSGNILEEMRMLNIFESLNSNWEKWRFQYVLSSPCWGLRPDRAGGAVLEEEQHEEHHQASHCRAHFDSKMPRMYL